MSTLEFADSHNMVTFLSKSAESEGFEQIVDFLNAHPIRYALTVNPTIYVSCIEQFWSSDVAKTINEEVELHALVDGKRIVITETSCLSPNTTAWNEFSSTMASAIICLATNQKFNFSKLIFDSMVRNLDNHSGKILMYPRNMKRVGKGFSGRVTPLFPAMVVQNQPQQGEENIADEAVHKERGDSLVRAATTASILEAEQDNGDTIAQTRFKNVSKHSNDPLLARGNTLRSGKDTLKLNELMELCTNLQQRVLDLETTKTTQANEIASLKRRVKKLEKKDRSRSHKLKRLYKVGLSTRVESSRDEEDLGEDASKHGRILDIDADTGITLVSTHFDADTDMIGVHDLIGDEVVVESEVAVKSGEKRNDIEEVVDVIDDTSTILVSVATITDVEITLAQSEEEEKERFAREKAQQVKEANIAWDDVQAKVKADYQLAQRLQAQEQEELTDEEKARLFVQFLEQRRKHFAAKRVEEKRNIPPTRAQQRNIITELVEESSKKAETELEENLKKAEAEVMEAKYGSTRPVEDLDFILYGDLKIMFEPHVEDQVWKNQNDYNVLDWKLYDSCGVHYLRIQHVYIHMLVEKKYPLTPSTITDILNKKLQVDYLKMKWHINFLNFSQNNLRINDVFGSILLVINEAFNEET
ncbi:hypothetical protein Tco_0554567 [Tanacetum coccineum]